ncbi:hypothetical protein GCM10009676_14860 [Prauserella halophila]|uniref:Uncharacterized protein n=1 Tax=Prauserella halophila TaxID=185641 RepID=A0ABN1W2U0_9PSEU|nr:hypothetical protein [Prauserella halophila]
MRSVLGDDETATDSEPDEEASEPDEETLRAALAKLAAEKPEWVAAARALDGTAENADHGNAASDLPQDGAEEEGGKIIHLDRFRRSAM